MQLGRQLAELTAQLAQDPAGLVSSTTELKGTDGGKKVGKLSSNRNTNLGHTVSLR